MFIPAGPGGGWDGLGRAIEQVARQGGLVGSFLRAYLPGINSQWRLAARIEAPTLVIGGLNDRLVDPRVPVQVARAIPDGRLLILPGVGHVAQMEVPRLVARGIVGLLDDVRQPAG